MTDAEWKALQERIEGVLGPWRVPGTDYARLKKRFMEFAQRRREEEDDLMWVIPEWQEEW